MTSSQKSTGARPQPPPAPPPRPTPPRSLTLPLADVSGLEVVRCPYNIRRDLYLFVDYVRGKQIKRAVRGNSLPKADATRLAKLMSDPDAADEIKDNGYSTWINFIDGLALQLGFVSYSTTGVYAGYSSQEASFPDNTIAFQADAYEKYLAASMAGQERRLLKALVDVYKRGEYDYSRNEFYATAVAGRLEPLNWAGAGVGVMPTLNFAEIREFLLGVLAACPVGVWLATADLVAYLKAHYPYFLIPQKPKPDRWGVPTQRYGNFREQIGGQWGSGKEIPDDAPDGFERVEGRYVERFLEYIPLTLGHVDVAYAEPEQKDLHPSINCLRAFRVNSRLAQALHGDLPEPKVTVQPNFEIYVEAELYPASVLARLTPLADVVKEDVITILKLRREKVATERAKNERLDVIGILEKLSGRELPQNVTRELREWTAQSETFTLFEGVTLFEGDLDLPAVAPFIVTRLAPGLALVSSSGDLYRRLETAEQTPMRVKHEPLIFTALPIGARTIFIAETPVIAAPPPPVKRWAELRRETRLTLHFPAGYDDLLERCRKALVEARCSMEVDKTQRTITYAKRYEGQVAAVIEGLKDEYEIAVADLE